MDYRKSILIPILSLLVSLINYNIPCNAQLSASFYDATCPNALTTISTTITAAVTNERRMAASLLRLHFHDCFVQGCDASILLSGAGSEQPAFGNGGVRGFSVIDDAKAAVESVCPGVVSCADILAVAARDAVVEVGGPSWSVRLGRRDSLTANRGEADTDLPLGNSSLVRLISIFNEKTLSVRDMVALSGAHTIGQARCGAFSLRIYANDSNIDPAYASDLRSNCPQTGGGNLSPLDFVTPNTFDINYFRNLVDRRGLLASDQALFNGDSTDSIVQGYVDNPATFDSDFAAAMVRMSEIDPLTGATGEIRTVCTSAN